MIIFLVYISRWAIKATKSLLAIIAFFSQVWSAIAASMLLPAFSGCVCTGDLRKLHLLDKMPKAFSITLLALDRRQLNIRSFPGRFLPGYGLSNVSFKGKALLPIKQYLDFVCIFGKKSSWERFNPPLLSNSPNFVLLKTL